MSLPQPCDDLASKLADVGCSSVGDFLRLTEHPEEGNLAGALAEAFKGQEGDWDRPRILTLLGDLRKALTEAPGAEDLSLR